MASPSLSNPQGGVDTPSDQASFDFLEALPDISARGNYTQMPNELHDFGMAYPDQGRARLFLEWFVMKTYGGQFDPNLGPRAKALRAKGARPKHLALTMAQIADVMRIAGESGAQKKIDFLVNETRVLRRAKAMGQIWYWIDYGRLAEFQPAEFRTVQRPQRTAPEVSNIPSDAPLHQAAQVTKDPISHRDSLIDSVQVADNTQPALKCCFQVSHSSEEFDRSTPVLKPGSDAPSTSPIGQEIEMVRVRDANGSIIAQAASLGRITSMLVQDRILDLTTDAILNLDTAGPITLAKLTADLNALLGDKLAANIPTALAAKIHEIIHTERAYAILAESIRQRWNKVKTWGLLYYLTDEGRPAGLAVEAAERYETVVAEDNGRRAREAAAEQRLQHLRKPAWMPSNFAEAKRVLAESALTDERREAIRAAWASDFGHEEWLASAGLHPSKRKL